MPRTAGVSASSTVWLIFFSPSPCTVSRWRCLVPASPFTRRTLSLFTEDFLDLLAAARRDLSRRAHRLQAVQRGAHRVVGVGRAEALGEDVGDAHHLEHGAHRPAGDDARALVSRLHQDPRRAPAPGHGVMQRAVLQLYLEKLAPRLLHRLLHGHRHLARLALAHADAAVLQLGPDVLLQRGGACDDLIARSGSELGIDMPVGAMHGETHRPDGADPEPGLACAPQAREVLVDHGLPGYFFLVSFKMMISPL